MADGLYDLHVVAYDVAGNVSTSTPISNLRIDNTSPAVTITNPLSSGSVANTVALGVTTTDADPSPAIVWQVAPHGTTTWTTVPASWNTKTGPDAVADGHYDIKATATDWATNVGSDTVTDITVDNQAPNVATTLPANNSYVNAASADPFTVAATADDNGTGVQQVVFSSCTTATCIGGTVATIGTDTTGSAGTYSAAWTVPADGVYWIRAAASDFVGHTSTDDPQGHRRPHAAGHHPRDDAGRSDEPRASDLHLHGERGCAELRVQARRRRLDDVLEPVLARLDAGRRLAHARRPRDRPRRQRRRIPGELDVARGSHRPDRDADRPGSRQRSTRDPRHRHARLDDDRPDDATATHRASTTRR